jgi:ketol-acid reductoisomerase
MRAYYDRDADLDLIKGSKVCIVGYSAFRSYRITR